MSIIPLSEDNFENYVIKTHTHRTFASSSDGLVGELKVFPRGSPIEKDTVPSGDITQDAAGKLTLEAIYNQMLSRVYSEGSLINIFNTVM